MHQIFTVEQRMNLGFLPSGKWDEPSKWITSSVGLTRQCERRDRNWFAYDCDLRRWNRKRRESSGAQWHRKPDHPRSHWWNYEFSPTKQKHVRDEQRTTWKTAILLRNFGWHVDTIWGDVPELLCTKDADWLTSENEPRSDHCSLKRRSQVSRPIELRLTHVCMYGRRVQLREGKEKVIMWLVIDDNNDRVYVH